MAKNIRIWWSFVREQGICKYIRQVLPSIVSTIVAFLVVNKKVTELINRYYIIFLFFIIVLIAAHIYTEWHRVYEFNNLKLECDKKDEEITEKENSICRLEEHLDHLEQMLKSLPTDFLHDFSNKIKLKNSDRMTFYVYKDNKFVNIGRYSKNSKFGKTLNGNTFEKGDNYISKCYHSEKEDFIMKTSLPDPDNNFDNYCRVMSNDFTKFDREELKNVTMKSRCYFARKIYNSDGNSIGVLMIESRSPNLQIYLNGENRTLTSKADYETLSKLIKQDFQYILQSLYNYIKNYY